MKLNQIRWASVAKIGAGVLLAVAIATSAPSLLGSEEPEPLDPDVGLPQAAIPPPPPPGPPPAPVAKPPKKRPKAEKRPRKPRHKPKRRRDEEASPASTPAVAVPSGSADDFGFERP